jgi:predicted DNA-binding transcriptional regulator AlpA
MPKPDKVHRGEKPPTIISPVLRRRDAIAFTGLRRSRFDELVKAHELPRPIKLTDAGKAVGWVRSELESWLATRITKRNAV